MLGVTKISKISGWNFLKFDWIWIKCDQIHNNLQKTENFERYLSMPVGGGRNYRDFRTFKSCVTPHHHHNIRKHGHTENLQNNVSKKITTLKTPPSLIPKRYRFLLEDNIKDGEEGTSTTFSRGLRRQKTSLLSDKNWAKVLSRATGAGTTRHAKGYPTAATLMRWNDGSNQTAFETV